MGEPARKFEDHPATRKKVPLLMGIVSPSGGGKTKSALRLATGMARVDGKPIFCVDTEADRALFYADEFRFQHVPFAAPFDPLSYLAAVEHCVKQGAGTIIIDSASHLHEGPGGTLEAHAAECTRLAKLWNTTEDKAKMSAWQKPKAELRRFLNTILQLKVNIIFCIRAKEKMKIIPGKNPEPLGFMPIMGDEFLFEMALNVLLYPGSDGVPSWHPSEMGEKAIVKLPSQFRDLFKANDKKPLSEDIGEALARWAAGGQATKEGAASAGGGAAPAASQASAQPSGSDTRAGAKLQQQWAEFWLKRRIPIERVLAHFGRRGVVDLTIGDLEAMAAMDKQLKAKTATAETFFPAPATEDEPAPEDRGDEPPLDEMPEPGSEG
jgi:hypothetical protein